MYAVPTPKKSNKFRQTLKTILLMLLFFVLAFSIIGGILAISTGPETAPQPIAEKTTEAVQPEETPAPKETKAVPRDYQVALEAAENYNKILPMSKKGMYSQLTSEFDEHSPEAAKYAVEHINADWNENALKSAKSYQETMHMSKKGIHKQLISEFDGYTKSQADYAIAHLDD